MTDSEAQNAGTSAEPEAGPVADAGPADGKPSTADAESATAAPATAAAEATGAETGAPPEAPPAEPVAEAAPAQPEPEPQSKAEPEPTSEQVAAAPASEPADAPAAPEAATDAEPETKPEQVAATSDSEPVAAPAESAEKKVPGEAEAATVEAVTEGEEPDTPFDKLVSRARRFSPERVRTILESLLLVTDKPLTVEAIQLTSGISQTVIKEQLEKLQGHYRDGVRGIVLHEVAGGWQFRTCPSTSDFVRRFLKVKPQRLTRAALETMAIIAYRQPVTRPEIEDIRAVDCGAVLKALLEHQLVKIIGKKEEPGRPLLYGTTTQFLEFFNLRDLGSLPTLREFQELNEESQAIVEQQAGEKTEQKGTDGLVADLRDSKLEERLKATTAEADDALADLETAIADTDTRTKATARILNPVAPGAPVPPGAAPTPGAGAADAGQDGQDGLDQADEGQEPEEQGGGQQPGDEEPEDEDEGGAADDEVPDELDDDDDE